MPQNKEPELERFVDLPAVAALFNVSTQTIRRWWQDNEFPAPLRVGRRRLFWHVGTIQNWIKEKKNVCDRIQNEDSGAAIGNGAIVPQQ